MPMLALRLVLPLQSKDLHVLITGATAVNPHVCLSAVSLM